MFKIKFKTKEDFYNLADELDKTDECLFSVNSRRRFITVEKLSEVMINKIKEMGGIIDDDYQYDLDK